MTEYTAGKEKVSHFTLPALERLGNWHTLKQAASATAAEILCC